MDYDDERFEEDDNMEETPGLSTPVVLTWIAIPVLLWVGARVSDYVRTTVSGIPTFDEERG